MQLKLINNLTKNTVELGEIEDKVESTIFYSFDITLPKGMNDGEYTYELFDGDKKVAEGLLQIGDYVKENKEYNNEKKYKVYGK